MTYDQVSAGKDKVERFVRNVLQDDDRADEIADESVESYADRKHYVISNPLERSPSRMANGNGDPRTKAELLDEIDDLQNQLDAINDILNPPSDDDDDDYDADDDTDDGDASD